ncbi:MAG: ornithine cyclodeaminase [Candidatus Bathyarchaeota archaeon]|nr:ornithine cyclodeaminase [Candidatus Bathyarchaeota archaeon]
MSSVEFIYLSQEDVLAAGGLDMKMSMEAIEKAFRLLNEDKVIIPSKIVLVLPPSERERGRINGLAAYIGGDWEMAGIKWVPSFPKNPQERGLPRANALIILNDTHTGLPLSVMDGTILSAMRTGAVGGIGAKYLAREDSEVVAIIGLGVQARTQALALKEALPNIKEIRGYDIVKEKAAKIASEIEEMTSISTKVFDNPRDVVEGADVIDTVTLADEPIVKDKWIKDGSLFIHMGSYIEEEYEVVLHSDKIIVDDWEVVKHRKTPILARMYDQGLISDKDIYANLDVIVAGKKPSRENDNERIFFSPIGMAHEDVAVASMVYDRAKREGIGQKLPLWTKPLWM